MSGIALPAPLRVGILYFCLAVAALRLTRFDGGVALLWFATAYLVAELSVVRRARWRGLLAAAAVASTLATGLVGMGWAAALPLAAANMFEAFVAAYLLRRQARQTPLESLKWLGHFALAAAVVAPVVSGALAALIGYLLGKSPSVTFVHWIAGHGLGNLTFAPLFILVAQGELRAGLRRLRAQGSEALGLIGFTLAAIITCFSQRHAPLLFIPILPIVFVTFRLGRGASALAILTLALIGGEATLAGHGPMFSLSDDPGQRAQYFQFYLAMTVLTVWPVVAELRTRTRLHNALHVSEERYRLIADYSSDILLKLSREGRIRYVSPSIRQLGAFEPASLIGRDGIELIPEPDRDRVRALYRQTLAEPDRAHCFEYEAFTADGRRRWFEAHSRAVIDRDGAAIGTMSIIRDVSERKATEQALSDAALTDVLTGLPNRRAFREMFDARSAGGDPGDCVAMLDIDHFKRVNDQHGHIAGDLVLRSFAATAVQAVRESDTVLRIGGEEFAVLFRDTQLDQALEICERLRARVAAAIVVVNGEQVRITVSGGVAPIGENGLAEAIKCADAALYRAKDSGRDRLAIAA